MLQKTIKILFVIFFLFISIYIAFDFQQFILNKKNISSKHLQTAHDLVLKLNSDQKIKISELLIEHKELFQSVLKKPDNTLLIDEIDTVFKNNLNSYFSFTIADHNGDLITDHFFDKVGRLCRQDMHKFAIDKESTWLTIHPGPEEYHYDLIIPWTQNEEERLVFLSFKIQSLVQILKNNEHEGVNLYLVRHDKNNLIEVSSKGSRNVMEGQVFLDDSLNYNTSIGIEGTYWSLIDVISIPWYKLYFKQRILVKLNQLTQ